MLARSFAYTSSRTVQFVLMSRRVVDTRSREIYASTSLPMTSTAVSFWATTS